MKAPGDKILSHWAPKGSYGKAMANDHGMGCGHLVGSKGSYTGSAMKSGRGAPKTGPVERNSPGKGSGSQSNRPVGGKSNRPSYKRMGRMDMGNSD